MQQRYPLPWFTPQPDHPCFCRSGRDFGQCCGLESDQREPPFGVIVQRQFLDPATCRKWVTRLKTGNVSKSTVQRIDKPGNARLSARQDPTRVCTEVKPGTLRKQINDRVSEAFRQVAGRTGDEVEWFETPTILRYQPGGYYMAHADNCLLDPGSHSWFRVNDRDLSLLIYLNDDFGGGCISFPTFNYRFHPAAGDLLVFPSDNRYIHEAEKVTSGLRFVIVSWATVAGSQRVGVPPPANAIRMQHA